MGCKNYEQRKGQIKMNDSGDSVQIKTFFKSGVYQKNLRRTSLRCQLKGN